MKTSKEKVPPRVKAHFIESMECLPVKKLPQGPEWSYEIKLDGFRLEAAKKNGETTLYSRRGNILNRKCHDIRDRQDFPRGAGRRKPRRKRHFLTVPVRCSPDYYG
jgi:ATP-dependent DNA ligase